MENYKINKSLGFVKLPFNLTTDFADPMDETRKSAMVETALAAEIGAINDYEMSAFKPHFANLILDVYFHMRIDPAVITDIRTMLSSPYTVYYDQMKTFFDGLNSSAVSDFANEGSPSLIENYPTFWNSLGYPYYTKKADWYVKDASGNTTTTLIPTRFGTQSYPYNSFIKMNVYTTPYAVSQELLFQNVIYVNPRWCVNEGDANGQWVRPTFQLNETTDGYYLFWLNKYDIDTFYVSFQFWDALNGRMINLLPCNDLAYDKQWVQSSSKFDSRSLYLEYKVSYTNKSYSIGEFNAATKTWDQHPNPIRLYELIFDNNLAELNPKISVKNGTAPPPAAVPPSPFDFHIDIPASINLTPSTQYDSIVTYDDKTTFQSIRSAFNTDITNVPESFKKVVKVKNNGATPIYLKNITFEITKQDESTRQTRLTGERRDPTGDGFSYSISSVPNPNIYQDNGLQFGFALKYHPERNTYDENDATHFGATVAVAGKDDNQPNYWMSEAWMSWFFPINSANFTAWGHDFAERLFVSHAGDDLTPIQPNEELPLTVNFGFGKNYGYVFLEPYYYSLCENVRNFQSKDYVVDLTYNVTLYFNDLTNSLPEDQNIKTFSVGAKYIFQYIHVEGGTGSGGRP
jgi:hypothetical protein